MSKNERLDANDNDAIAFNNFLLRLRDGNCTTEDWLMLRNKCSKYSIGFSEWKERGFDNPEIISLFPTYDQVDKFNTERIKQLNMPINCIKSKNTGKANKYSSAQCKGLLNSIYLSVGSQIMLTNNEWVSAGLSNGSTGIVKDIIYDATTKDYAFPECIIIDFENCYKGPQIFESEERKTWYPLFPKTSFIWEPSKNGWIEHSRTMFALKLSWALSIHKSQGQTMKSKYSARLGDKEMDHGLTYVALSRARKFSDIGLIDGITEDRLCRKVKLQAKMKPRLEEDKRLHGLFESTKIKYSYSN